VLETSAVLAILLGEPERRAFAESIEAAERRSLSAAGFVETSVVLEFRHRAGLNVGDCFAYALAKCRSKPWLFKGDHFSETDVLLP
jgi:ribonuclease VapC